MLVLCENSWVVFNIVELGEISLIANEVERNGSVVENINVEMFVVGNVKFVDGSKVSDWTPVCMVGTGEIWVELGNPWSVIVEDIDWCIDVVLYNGEIVCRIESLVSLVNVVVGSVVVLAIIGEGEIPEVTLAIKDVIAEVGDRMNIEEFLDTDDIEILLLSNS